MEVPDPSGDRLFIETDNDRRGSLLVVTIISTVYSALLLTLRAVARRASYEADDYIALAATVASFVHFSTTFVAISNQLGTNPTLHSDETLIHVGQAYVAGDVFMFITLWLTKCSVIILCRRLFVNNMRKHKSICDVVLVISTLWCIGAIVAALVSCDALFRVQGTCVNMLPRWHFIGILDGVTELLIVIIAAIVVIPLQMPAGRKLSVMGSFLPRLLLLIPIILHLTTLSNGLLSPNFWRSLTRITIYREVQIVYALFSAALPVVNRLLRKFDTRMGGDWYANSSSGTRPYATGGVPGAAADYELSHMASSNGGAGAAKKFVSNTSSGGETGRDSPAGGRKRHKVAQNFRPERNFYTTTSSGGPRESEVDGGDAGSQRSDGSEANIIRKDVRWDVQYQEMNDVTSR